MAFSLQVCLVAVLGMALCASAIRLQAASFPIGGATSFEQLANVLGMKTSVGTGAANPAGACKATVGAAVYQSVGSGNGITNFNSGLYAVALSDSPMTVAQEKTGVSAKGKITLPIIMARYSFFVSGVADGTRMTAAATYAAFKSATGYTPVSRSDSSGTTFVIKRYWKVAGVPGFAADIKADAGLYGTSAFPASWAPGKMIKAAGTDGVCNAAAAGANRITYAQIGVCNRARPGLGEISLPNKVGTYILASGPTATAIQAIPRAPPAFTASWVSMGEATILSPGAATPAIASFIYAFVPKKLTGRGANAKLGKAILGCFLEKLADQKLNLAATLDFDALPVTLFKKVLTAAKAVPV